MSTEDNTFKKHPIVWVPIILNFLVYFFILLYAGDMTRWIFNLLPVEIIDLLKGVVSISTIVMIVGWMVVISGLTSLYRKIIFAITTKVIIEKNEIIYTWGFFTKNHTEIPKMKKEYFHFNQNLLQRFLNAGNFFIIGTGGSRISVRNLDNFEYFSENI